MKKMIFILVVALTASCYTTRTTVGSGPMGKDATAKVFSKVKQSYLFRGAIPLGFAQASLPKDNNYQIRTSHKFIDLFLTSLTFGIYSQQTVEILTK